MPLGAGGNTGATPGPKSAVDDQQRPTSKTPSDLHVRRFSTLADYSSEALVAAVGIVVLAACGAGSSSSTRATVDALAKVDYPGRLLLSVPGPAEIGSPKLDHLSQLTSGSPNPTDLNGPSTDGYINAVSSDGLRIAYNAGSGARQLTVFGPGGTEAYQGWFGAGPMVFSPDGKRLAYNRDTSVQVSDPVTHRFVDLPLRTECRSYSRGPADSSEVRVCGGVEGPVWLDPTTLYLTHFVGEMPSSVSCRDTGSCSVPPNTASIVPVAGTIVTSTTMPPTYAPVIDSMETRSCWTGLPTRLRSVAGSTLTSCAPVPRPSNRCRRGR